jgi:hypothetical protein
VFEPHVYVSRRAQDARETGRKARAGSTGWPFVTDRNQSCPKAPLAVFRDDNGFDVGEVCCKRGYRIEEKGPRAKRRLSVVSV